MNMYNPININVLNRIKFIDTLNLAKSSHLRNERHNQPGLCKKYQITNQATHRALGDVKALEQLYIKMCEQFSFHRKMEQNYSK